MTIFPHTSETSTPWELEGPESGSLLFIGTCRGLWAHPAGSNGAPLQRVVHTSEDRLRPILVPETVGGNINLFDINAETYSVNAYTTTSAGNLSRSVGYPLSKVKSLIVEGSELQASLIRGHQRQNLIRFSP